MPQQDGIPQDSLSPLPSQPPPNRRYLQVETHTADTDGTNAGTTPNGGGATQENQPRGSVERSFTSKLFSSNNPSLAKRSTVASPRSGASSPHGSSLDSSSHRVSFHDQLDGNSSDKRSFSSTSGSTLDNEFRRGGNNNPNQQDDQTQALGGSSMLPSIGIVEKKVNAAVSSPEAMSPTSTPHGKARRRTSYLRRASVDEIKYFTDLLRKSMTMERPKAATYDDNRIMQTERMTMATAEKEQCKVDRFWGFEYEKKQQGENMTIMFQEDIRSRYHQDELQLADKWELWSDYDLNRKKEEARHKAWLEQKRRRSYLREFYSLDSSDNILHYHWPTSGPSWGLLRTSAKAQPETATEPPQPPAPSRGYTLDTVKLNLNSKRVLGTFHVDRKRYLLLHSSTMRGDETSSVSGRKRAPPFASPTSKRTLGLDNRPAYLPDTCYGMDEQSVLKGLFDSVDTGRRGTISREQFVKAVRYDQRTQGWLQKTFLWSLYKARKWSLLLDMFDMDSSGLVTFVDFYYFIQKCQLEANVPPNRVRWPRDGRGGYLLESRLNRPLPHQEAGRQVEFLFQRGPIWQPGRIVRANSDGTYDIRCDLYDGDVFLKIETPPEQIAGLSRSHSNNQQEELEEDKNQDDPNRFRDENEVLDFLFDRVQGLSCSDDDLSLSLGKKKEDEGGHLKAGVETSTTTSSSQEASVRPEDLLKAVRDPNNVPYITKCKAMAALRDYPVMAEALKYIASDDRMPGISRQEFHVFCDAIADLLAINDLGEVIV